MTDLILGAALIAFAVGILVGAVATYNAWQNDVRDLTTKLRIAEQRADWARRQAMDDHPAGRVVRGPWGGAS